MYADIIVDITHEKLDRVFQYRIPERLTGQIETGTCVEIPFGNSNRVIKGYCVSVSETCSYEPGKIKEIIRIPRKDMDVEDCMVALACWMKKNYGGTMIQALKTVLPVKQSVKHMEKKTLVSLLPKDELISVLGECKRKKQTAKERVLEALICQPRIPYEWVTGKLNVTASTVKSLENACVVKVESENVYRNPVNVRDEEDRRYKLSNGQQEIVDAFLTDFSQEKYGTYLIFGITGSGKTQVYLQMIEEVVQKGRQAIVLIPEIALTYQTMVRFYQRFGSRVSVMNSTLSAGEKYDQCERAKNGELDVIIGPRSALFTPFPNLGLIVIDEEHENSYKSESTPKYHAVRTAEEVARIHKASVVLGSATPSLESYYRAKKGEIKLFRLKERLTGQHLPEVSVVDMRKELAEGNRSIFSRQLKELLEDRLIKGQQSMLFLNRRGYAGFISCRSCGLVIKCPHCDVSLSEHKDGMLWCHYCGYHEPKKMLCPKCGSKYIMGFKAGTQQIEDKLRAEFPQARVLRMDADTTRTKDSYEKILSSFANEEADILIGTQMIVKGHDFPKVTLVGVLAADLSLGCNDYRAGERTFQLLAQAVGRAGRGSLPGQAVIQTYQPEHYAVSYAANQDYEGFFEEELLYREMGGYPPVVHMLAVTVFGKYEENVKRLALNLAGVVKSHRVLGPSKGTIGKINDVYRYVFYVKNPDYDRLVEIKDLLEKWLVERQPKWESVQFDFNPMNSI